MNVEREIGGFALPFTAGVLITAYAGLSFCMYSSLVHHLGFTLILTAICGLLIKRHQRSYLCTWGLISLGATGCGILSAATGISLNLEMPLSALEALAYEFGTRMQSAIDSIPFDSADTGALVKALLTGERDSLPGDIIQSFRDSGASHILALSGLHLGIIYMLFSKILGVLGNSILGRRCRSCLTILSCGFYTMATGAGPSITRAFLFIVLGEAARLSGRYRSLSQLLFSSLILHLTVSPLSIRSVSFQLSYAAMAGIAFIFPWLKGFWPDSHKGESIAGRTLSRAMQWIWVSAALSISCQLTTAPLAYMYFGTIPTHFILTNLIALPLIGILIPAAVLTLCLIAAGCCPGFVIQLTEAVADLLSWSLKVIATM